VSERTAPKLGPGRAWYALAAVLFVAGVAASAWEILLIVSLVGGGVEFLAPGREMLTVKKPGRHVIWHEFKTVYSGRAYSSDPALPDGTTIKVFSPDGKELVVRSDTGASMKSGDTESHSVCTFEADKPGEYAIVVSSLDTPHVMMVRKSLFGRAVATFVICTILEALGWLLAPAMAIIVAIMRFTARRRASEEGKATPV
jgi:hypothetical protein